MIVLCSGGVDPLHIGHVRYFQAAAGFGRVIVALNSDAWLTRKKGKPFMKWDERREILLALSCVAEVIPVDDADGTVCEAILRIRPDLFAKGGDRDCSLNVPEAELCKKLGIEVRYGVGGFEKIQSSSKLIAGL
jgi:cytidyltransferase-like protein